MARLTSSLVAVLSATAFAADVPVPSDMQGSYQGKVYNQYGTADPANPASFECITDAAVTSGGSMAASGVPLTLSANSVVFGAFANATKQINNAVYGMAGRSATEYQWADWTGANAGATGGIVKLRAADQSIVCKFASFSGGTLTFVTLGGTAYTWEDQCSLAAYQAIPDFQQRAYCMPVSATNLAPAASTVLEVYGGRTGGSSSASRGAALMAAAAAAAVAVAVAVAA